MKFDGTVRRGVSRALWLAELANSIAASETVLALLTRLRGHSAELLILDARLTVARDAVEALRRGRAPAFDPVRTD